MCAWPSGDKELDEIYKYASGFSPSCEEDKVFFECEACCEKVCWTIVIVLAVYTCDAQGIHTPKGRKFCPKCWHEVTLLANGATHCTAISDACFDTFVGKKQHVDIKEPEERN